MEEQAEQKDDQFIILVIEKEDYLAGALCEILSLQGFETCVAHTGRQAMKLLVEHRPDLIVLCDSLPDICGFALCKNIKDDDNLKDIPVIMTSWKKDLENRLNGFLSGAQRFVTKPYRFADIIDNVLHYVHRSRKTIPEPQGQTMI